MILLALFILIQVADVATTAIGLKRGADEANLLPAFLFARFGFWPSVVGTKLIGVALAVAATLLVKDGAWFTGTLDLIGTGVLAWNLHVLRQA
jgi:hypothetical protein